MLPVILGTGKFGTYINRGDSFAVLDGFVELGGTRLDTANNYAIWHPEGKGGESERVLGEWLSQGRRDRVEVMTKIGAQSMDGLTYQHLDGLSPNNILKSVDDCLTRLQTDYIDVLYAHVDDPNTPLLTTWKTLSSLVEQGVVKSLGISNYTEPRVLELMSIIKANDLTPFKYAQYRYSLLSPNIDARFVPQVVMNEHLFGTLRHLESRPEIIGYSPLLDGCYEGCPDELPDEYDNLLNSIMVEDLQMQAGEICASPSSLVLKTIADYGVTPLTAASTPDKLKDNLRLFF